MADDVNKSKKPVNSVASVGASVGRRSQNLEQVIKRAEQSVHDPIATMREHQMRLAQIRERRRNLQQEMDYVISNIGSTDPVETADEIAALQRELDTLAPGRNPVVQRELQALKSQRSVVQERRTKAVNSAVTRYISPAEQESRIRMLGRGSKLLGSSVYEAESRGYKGLEQQRDQAVNSAGSLALQIESAQEAGDMDRVKSLSQEMASKEQQAAIATRGMQYLRGRGRDPDSILMRSQNVIDRAERRSGMESMMSAGQAGELRGLGEIGDEIKQVTQALKELRAGLNSGSTSLEDFNDEAEKLTDKFEKLELEEKAVKAAGGDSFDRFTRGYNLASTAARSLVQVSQRGLVDFRIAGMGSAAQLARQQNQQYDMMRGAAQGDIMSQMMVLGGIQNAARFQDEVATAQKGTKAAEGSIELADTAFGTYTGMKLFKALSRGGKSLLSGDGGVLSSALAGATGSASRTAVNFLDVGMGISEMQAGNAAYQAAMQAQMEIARVPARQVQAYGNYVAGAGIATRGAGRNREREMVDITGRGFMGFLRTNRIDQDRALDLLNQGYEAQGGDIFNARSSLELARSMESEYGLGTMEQQFQRMGNLANANAFSPDVQLEHIMQEAIARGFDNSKAVGMMVDATVSLAQTSGSAQLGIDATGGITSLIGRALGKSDPNTANAAEIRAAQTGIQQGGDLLTDRTISFSQIVRDTQLKTIFGGDPTKSISAATLDFTQIETLKKGDKAALDLVYQKGLSDLLNEDGTINLTAVKEYEQIQRNFAKRGGASGVGYTLSPETNKRVDEIEAKLTARGISLSDTEAVNEALSPEERDIFMARNRVLNIAGGGNVAAMQLRGSMQDLNRPKLNRAPTAGEKTASAEILGTDVTKIKESMAGEKALDGDVRGLALVKSLMETTFEENMGKFGDAAAEAVEKMRNDVNTEVFKKLAKSSDELGTKFGNLGKQVDNLSKKVGNLNFGNMILPENPEKILTEKE